MLTKKNSTFRVRLTRQGLILVKESETQTKETVIPIKDIIGCRCLRSKKERSCSCQSLPRSSLNVVDENSGEQDDSDISAYLYVYAYILQYNKDVPVKRERTIITLRFRSFDKYEDNNKEAQKWRLVIKMLIRGENPNPSLNSFGCKIKDERKLLVLCNPKSGPGKGRSIFLQKIAPVLLEAEIPYDLHITKYANYAREFVRQSNIFNWSAIVLVGGDGIIFEAINGLFERFDWEEAVRTIPLGVIPGGSGNGLARSIAHNVGEPYTTNTTLPSALSLVRNTRTLMDLVRVETTSQILFSFLSVGWGFLSDIDIESEKLRILGGQRFTIWSLARLIGLRSYGGRVWYLPATNTPVHNTHDVKKPDNIEIPTEMNLETQTGRQRVDSWYSAASKRSAYFSATTNSSYQSTADSGPDENHKNNVRMYGPPSQLPCLNAPPPSNWQCMEGRFIMVHASYPSHLGEDCLFVPEAKLNDGIIWLVIIKADATRSQVFHFLLGLSDGTHMNTDCGDAIQMLPTRAFRIEPDMHEKGYMTVDGEHVEYGPIQGEIFPGLASVLVP